MEAGKHPNADRLQLCRVDVGEGEPRQIVCGAWNFGAGATVAVALPGRSSRGRRPLGEATLRGELSRGMILSERELELGSDHPGILVLEQPYEPGTPLADVLPLAEDVLEVEVTGNRPDLLSVYGLAREVAALFELELASVPGRSRISRAVTTSRSRSRSSRPARSTSAGSSATSVSARRRRGCARLSAAGMRPISNVVDATNYTMLALGSPLHAFDHDTLAEGRSSSATPGRRDDHHARRPGAALTTATTS